MKCCLRYLLYITLSSVVATFSFISGEEHDFLFALSNELLPILITLIVLYTTLSQLILDQLSLYTKSVEVDIRQLIKELKRNIKWEFIILAVYFMILLLNKIAIAQTAYGGLQCIMRFIVDMCTFFSVFYFLYVVYDSTSGFYTLYTANHDNKDKFTDTKNA